MEIILKILTLIMFIGILYNIRQRKKYDELDKTSLAIGASGSAATLVTGVGGTPAAFVGTGFVVGNTIYSFNAELEKDKLREEYKLWKTGRK